VNGRSSGSIAATGTATVNVANSLVLNVSNYVPNNTTYRIIYASMNCNGQQKPDISICLEVTH
jgi:hypothetical protein